MNTKRLSPAALHALKEALSILFWYKNELRSFLAACIDQPGLLAQLDWTAYKRAVVASLVDTLAASPARYTDDLLKLCLAVAEYEDPVHLKKKDDNGQQYREAREAIKNLADIMQPYKELRQEEEQADQRRRQEQAAAAMRRTITDRLAELNAHFMRLVSESDSQRRGYALEALLKDLLELYDIDAKGSFRITGEQIDGAFSFEGSEYLLEAKWTTHKTPRSELDTFASNVQRKLDNTLGLFVSINGFEDTAVSLHSGNRSVIILMDGADLSAVLDDRISLPELLVRKKQHAARTGQVYISAYSILS